MPEYDPVDYPAPLTDDLTHEETGRLPGPHTPWRANPALPEAYDGPPASREFETAGLGRPATGRALPPDPAPSAGSVEPSTSPPPAP